MSHTSSPTSSDTSSCEDNLVDPVTFASNLVNDATGYPQAPHSPHSPNAPPTDDASQQIPALADVDSDDADLVFPSPSKVSAAVLARQNESMQPVLYNTEARKTLVLHAGLTVDNKASALSIVGAWMVKLQKPVRGLSKKCHKAHPPHIHFGCYHGQCKCWIHFKHCEKEGGVGYHWCLVDFIDHSPHCNLSFSSPSFKKKYKFSPFPRCVMAYALIPRLLLEKPSQTVSTAQHQLTLQDFYGYRPSPSVVSKLKSDAIAIMYQTSQNPQSRSTSMPQDCLPRLMQYMKALREAGHEVRLTTQTGAQLRAVVLATAKSQHARSMTKRPASHRFKFDPQPVKRSKFYLSINPADRFLHSILFAPSTSMKQFDSLPSVASSDMAHVYSRIGGVIYARVAQDAQHKSVPLVVGYFADNETAKCHTAANQFTCATYPTFDEPGQVDVTDGHKGGHSSSEEVFEHVHTFLCNNHICTNMQKHCGTDAKQMLQQCQHAVSLQQLAHLKSYMTPRALEYLEAVAPDENQFMCAAQAQGHAMHGVYTNNVAESFNKSAKPLRAGRTIFALVQGLVELCHHAFHQGRTIYQKHVDASGTMLGGKFYPPYVDARLRNTLVHASRSQVAQHLGGNKFKVFTFKLGDVPTHVNLNALDMHDTRGNIIEGPNFAQLCCGVCALKMFPCPKVLAALQCINQANPDGMLEYLHPSMRLPQWKKQWSQFSNDKQDHFKLPHALNDVPVQVLQPRIKLTSVSPKPTSLSAPPLVPAPTGRPKGTTTTRTMSWGRRPAQAKKPRTCTACNHVCGRDARTCKGRSALPLACTRSFHYEHQQFHLCAKHAINNLLAMPFVTEDDLNEFASQTNFAQSEGRGTGFAMSSIMDLLTSRDLKVRLLRNNTSHVLPHGEGWATTVSAGLGIIVHEPGHYYAIVCMRGNPTYYRLINSVPTPPREEAATIKHFKSARALGEYMDKLSTVTSSGNFPEILHVLWSPQAPEHPVLELGEITATYH